MYRHFHGAQPLLRALTPTLLLVFGCTPRATTPTQSPETEHRVDDDRYLAIEALPSRATAELLPADARYRVLLTEDGTLALVIVAPDQRILGRLHIAHARPLAVAGTRVEYEDVGGRATQVEAWSLAGSIDGRAQVGDQSARFRVRLEPDGSLAGERWSLAHGDVATPELVELLRARAIGADLGALAASLSSHGALAERERCELGELLALAELALELSVRAWAGEDRARLPAVDDFVQPNALCRL